MKYLSKYKTFESLQNLNKVVNDFISEVGSKYNFRFGQPFDKEKANCSWFTKTFFDWAKGKSLPVEIVYFDSEIEAHIAPLLYGKVIDFAVKQFTKNPNDDFQILNIEDYKKWGYQKSEILNEFPDWATIREADLVTESSQNYGIHDWIEDLKAWEWNSPNWSQSQAVNPTSIKKWSDHFIGDGWYDKIESLVDRMFESLKKVDVEEINLRMYDVYDQIPSDKDRYVIRCIAYGDVDRYDYPNKRRYNGLVSVINLNERDKLRVIVHIIKDIVFPTLNIGGYPSYFLRQSDESYYVTEPKWQCQNFNIKDYEEFGIKDGASFEGDSGKRVIIHSSDIAKKEKYSISKILDMYRPCVDIEIGGHSDSIRTGKMNLIELESHIDETLESILPSIDYEEVIFDHSRGDRLFTNNDIYDYSIKILLNF